MIYIRDLLGHASVVTSEVYAKTNPKIKEEEIKKHGASLNLNSDYSEDKKSELIEFLKNKL